ncbi:hypothetical protein [Nonomuraea guangzhouensis]|uniref:FtsX-like permease family protein n=1 Tax=Nonomuraea guangzhouensis TaxID=1291555 RepID=A0ABW4GCS5_9ACTN|nr:hypothetical protein [Nonomuraea guangzhouensis]
MIFDPSVLLRISLAMAIPGVFAYISVMVAALTAPGNRHVRIRRRYLAGGLFVSFIGVGMMAFGAWSAREDSRYDNVVLIGLMLMTLIGGGLLLLGFGPFASWLLEILGRCAERLPLPVRLAVRDLASRRATTAAAITMTAMATSFGIALTIVAVGMTTQDRAYYSPSARPGALVVKYFSAEQAGAVRAAIQKELPGVPIAQSESPREYRHFGASAENLDPLEEPVYPHEVIGDEALLRYITGDQSTPYDEGQAVVVVNADVKVDSVEIDYDVTGNNGPLASKTIPAIVARTVDPNMQTIFVPTKVVRDLGYRLEPEELIVDPSLRRISASEQERLDSRLGDVAETYVERGFQASISWLPVAAATLLIALYGALTTGYGKTTNARPGRVLRRAGDGSTATFRWFGASRAGLSAACGTVLGAVAGCPIGMLLIWPLTAPAIWEDPPRVPFETPWLTIAAVVVGLPVLAAALGGFLAREQADSDLSVSRRAA